MNSSIINNFARLNYNSLPGGINDAGLPISQIWKPSFKAPSMAEQLAYAKSMLSRLGSAVCQNFSVSGISDMLKNISLDSILAVASISCAVIALGRVLSCAKNR